MFSGTLSLTQENHHFIVQISKKEMQSMEKITKKMHYLILYSSQ